MGGAAANSRVEETHPTDCKSINPEPEALLNPVSLPLVEYEIEFLSVDAYVLPPGPLIA